MNSTKSSDDDRERIQSIDHATLVDMYVSLDAKFQQLADYVRDLVTKKYGRQSERFESPGQLLMFPGADPSPAPAAESQPAASRTKTTKPKATGHSRNKMPDNLKRVEVLATPPPAAELACPCCSAARIPARKVLQNSQYQYVPASFYVEDHYAVIYTCPNGHDSEQLVVKVSEAVRNGIAGSGLLAQVAVARDFDHMPFNRQSTVYLRSGVKLSRSTLSDLYAHLAVLLTPLYALMHSILLESRIVSTDDTPVKVLDRKKEKNVKTGRKWIYMGDELHPVNLFDYTQGRGRDGPLTFLQGFGGVLQGDCFSGNLAICAAMGTTLVACIAHARRYFIKAMLNDKEGCNHALLMFQALYEIEKTAKELELPTSEITLMRQQEALPLLNNFHQWLQFQYARCQPKSSFGKALYYCLNNWNELQQYVKDGELKIDNNHCEREMKYVAMGKKAWLFFGSDEGGKNHAIVASILSTCRRHGVEPWAYLNDIIQRITENDFASLEELLPFNWKQKYFAQHPAEMPVAKDAPKVKIPPATFEKPAHTAHTRKAL
jgi:transposase